MSQSKLRSFLGITITILCLIAAPLQSLAADKSKTKAAHPAKERLVLMPIRVPDEDKNLTGAMETALVKGLQQKYDVFSGERVAQKAHEIFMKESRNTTHTECDETRCMQNIAEAFQAELIATANVTKQDGSYFLALSIQNIFDNKVEYSESLPCKNCDATQVVEKLKDLSGTPTPKTNQAIRLPAKENSLRLPEMVSIPGKNYEIGKYEVTQGEWRAVMDNNPSKFAKCGDNCPVEQVSWKDVQEFIQKLNSKTGSNYRLPSEGEWEYACYGGSKAEYCGGNDINAVAWYKDNSNDRTHPVGQKQANGYGLYDMSGNVSEWMSNCWDNNYCEGGRVLRGGSWYTNPNFTRTVSRFNDSLAIQYDAYGFRLARTISNKESKFKEPEMVRIPGKNYEIGKYEDTQAEWKAVMGNNPSHFKDCGDTCPVEQVSWDDSQTYIRKLNKMTGKEYRLPSADEWEYACYGGTKTKYCGGDDLDSVAWYSSNSDKTTHPVGQKQANGYGLYDMTGNVWEHMQEKYDVEHDSPLSRGGSWVTDPIMIDATFRHGLMYQRDSRIYGIGLRLARTLQ